MCQILIYWPHSKGTLIVVSKMWTSTLIQPQQSGDWSRPCHSKLSSMYDIFLPWKHRTSAVANCVRTRLSLIWLMMLILTFPLFPVFFVMLHKILTHACFYLWAKLIFINVHWTDFTAEGIYTIPLTLLSVCFPSKNGFQIIFNCVLQNPLRKNQWAVTKEKCRGRRRRCSHLHIKAKVLLLFKEEIQHKLPHKVGVQCIIDYFCPTKLEETERKRKSISCWSISESAEGKSKTQFEGPTLTASVVSL